MPVLPKSKSEQAEVDSKMTEELESTAPTSSDSVGPERTPSTSLKPASNGQRNSKVAGEAAESSVRVSTFDTLINPLRSDHPFGKLNLWILAAAAPQDLHFKLIIDLTISEIWAPKEIALFEACICKFGKKFAVYKKFVSAALAHPESQIPTKT